MSKYCKFLKDLYYKETLIFAKDNEYKVDYENDELYQFDLGNIEYTFDLKTGGRKGQKVKEAISKKHENELFVVIEKEDVLK